MVSVFVFLFFFNFICLMFKNIFQNKGNPKTNCSWRTFWHDLHCLYASIMCVFLTTAYMYVCWFAYPSKWLFRLTVMFLWLTVLPVVLLLSWRICRSTRRLTSKERPSSLKMTLNSVLVSTFSLLSIMIHTLCILFMS